MNAAGSAADRGCTAGADGYRRAALSAFCTFLYTKASFGVAMSASSILRVVRCVASLIRVIFLSRAGERAREFTVHHETSFDASTNRSCQNVPAKCKHYVESRARCLAVIGVQVSRARKDLSADWAGVL